MGSVENIREFQQATAQSQLAATRRATVSTIGHGQLASLHMGVRVRGRDDPADLATVVFT